MKRENVILIRVDDYVYKRVEEIVEESKDLELVWKFEAHIVFDEAMELVAF